MDLSSAPKLVAAALLGGAAVTSLPRAASAPDVVVLKLEWIDSGKTKSSDSLDLRTVVGETTEVRQGTRKVEATPLRTPDGTMTTRLKVVDTAKDAPEELSTTVRAEPGETNVVMGTVRKKDRSSEERLFFLTARPI